MMLAKQLILGASSGRRAWSMFRTLEQIVWAERRCSRRLTFSGSRKEVQRTLAARWPPSICVRTPFMVRMYTTSQPTVDLTEMKKFQSLAQKWWDEQGEFSALHSMNDLRVPFIRDTLINYVGSHQPGSPLSGIKLLDVGCGGGLLSEPLARLGAMVTGIDPLEDSIKTAELHKSFDSVLNERIQYKACSLEDITEEAAELFDAVVASEVLEHVADRESFIKCCNQVLKPGGHLFITTINKTSLSYGLGIIAAEQIFSIVPSGTHDWEKFVIPEELERQLESNGFFVESISGMMYNPYSGSWSWIGSTSISYAVHAVKTKDPQQSESEEPVPEKESEQSHVSSGASTAFRDV